MVDYTNPKLTNSPGEKIAALKKKKKSKWVFKFFIFLTIFIITSGIVFSTQIIISDQNSESWIYKIPLLGSFKHLVESADKELKGQDKDRINILLLGMGGKYHEGGYLTDTIMLASLQPSTEKIALLSIPRDLSIPVENMGWRKINNINAYAEVETQGSGGLAASQAISDILDIPVDYYVRIDFEGFINIVDELGGLKIYVDNTLDDYKYPIMGQEEAEPYESRFEHLHIDEGLIKMDGELALKYVRSRHAAGVEGSDFARARRQQKVLSAIKDKVFSMRILFKPRMVTGIINELEEHVSTNLKIWEIVKIWELFKDIKTENIFTKVLDNSPDGMLVDLIAEEGAYVLVPRYGDFAEIQYLFNNIFSDAPTQFKEKVLSENATIEVRNGTWINGLASQVAVDLEKYGFDVIRIGNSSRKNFQKSVIYDLTFGEKIESLAILKDKTSANVSYELPQWLIDDISLELTNIDNPEQPNFILILGQVADITSSGTENPNE